MLSFEAVLINATYLGIRFGLLNVTYEYNINVRLLVMMEEPDSSLNSALWCCSMCNCIEQNTAIFV